MSTTAPAAAAATAAMATTTQAVVRGGAVNAGCNAGASTVQVPAMSSRTPKQIQFPWFHGKITREEAEELLRLPSATAVTATQRAAAVGSAAAAKTTNGSCDGGGGRSKDGYFLVRESTNFVGDYTLCVSFQGKVEHYRIMHQRSGRPSPRFTIDDDEYFDSLAALVRHYKEDADGLCTRLTDEVANKAFMEILQSFKDAGLFIQNSDIKECEKIGKGEFGDVMLGVYKGEKVAVKIMKELEDKRLNQFLAEADVMMSLKHENLVCLKGVVVEPKSWKIVTEFMTKGSLLEYLRSRGRQYVTRMHQIKFALDTCRGMAYLESKSIIHRDLAARNVLISEKDSAKVSDFGLAIQDDTFLDSGKLPVKWTAPEALKEHKFTSKSDMWSFGVLLWEIYSFGRVPYPRIPINDVVKYVEKNNKMEAPEGCPDSIYNIMLSAWNLSAVQRPTFNEIYYTLETLQSEISNGCSNAAAVNEA